MLTFAIVVEASTNKRNINCQNAEITIQLLLGRLSYFC